VTEVYNHHRLRSARTFGRCGDAWPQATEPALHPLASDLPTIERFVSRVAKRGPVRCCYEAGPCGVALQRSSPRIE
jgi:hypothetical protein